MSGSEEMKQKQQDDFLAIYQAYQNLRSVTGWRRRRALDAAWRNYKDNYEDVVPLFGEQTVASISVKGRSFTREEVLEKIEHFLKCLEAQHVLIKKEVTL